MDLDCSIEDVEPSYAAVVAIDLGTANSGFAFSHKKYPKRVKRPANESDGKVPTILLLTPEKRFDSFGHKARRRHEQLEEEEAQKWFYFERFKMELHATKVIKCLSISSPSIQAFPEQSLNDETWIKALNEKEMKAKDIFCHALTYFREEAEKAVGLRSRRIKWVLTVPAIWTLRARQFMRDAAYQVNLHFASMCISRLALRLV